MMITDTMSNIAYTYRSANYMSPPRLSAMGGTATRDSCCKCMYTNVLLFLFSQQKYQPLCWTIRVLTPVRRQFAGWKWMINSVNDTGKMTAAGACELELVTLCKSLWSRITNNFAVKYLREFYLAARDRANIRTMFMKQFLSKVFY